MSSDSEPDPELMELLYQRAGLGTTVQTSKHATTIPVLDSAQYVVDNSIDVILDRVKTKEAAKMISSTMQKKKFSTKTWSTHELHPKRQGDWDEDTVAFIFVMDLLNFSFWSEENDESKRFAVEYKGRRWTGYWGLVAILQRALDEQIPIKNPEFWIDEEKCSEDVLRHVFRSATEEQIPLFNERVVCLREAGRVLVNNYDGKFVTCVQEADGSAAYLVNLLADEFSCFRDIYNVDDEEIKIYKRAQILVADLWACFEGKGYGKFDDIDQITMFADYRVPQLLSTLGCLRYSPPLANRIRQQEMIPHGSSWEIELRGNSIWCVEMIRREIVANYGDIIASDQDAENGPDDGGRLKVNAILIDFLLYDTMKELQQAEKEDIPHHRTRSIWY